jgi:hypothetical protein
LTKATLITNFWRRVRCIAEACLKREGLAFCAFIAAVGFAVVLTFLLIWNIGFLQDKDRTDDIAYLAFGILGLFGITQLSIHRLLGAKQAIELEFWKIKAKLSQGEDVPAPTVITETKTTIGAPPQ